MYAHSTTITRKGQITLPAAVRRALDLKQGDRVEVEVEEGHAIVRRANSVVLRTAGAVTTDQAPLSASELRNVAERAWAEDAVERGR